MSGKKLDETQSARHPDPVVRAASDWLVAQDRGLTPQEREEFDRWLDADIRHAEIFGQLKQTWAWLADVPAPAPGGALAGDSKDGLPQRSRRRQWAWAIVPLAAAAGLAMAAVGWRFLSDRTFTDERATQIGATQEMRLPDGSVVQLNTDSAVAVKFTFGERRVRLTRGEAHFEVAKNPARPFVVNARGVDVRAVGTAFNVRLQPETVEVLVTEGKVRVDDAASGQTVLPRMPGSATHSVPAGSEGKGAEPTLAAGQRAVVRVADLASAALQAAKVAQVATPEIDQMLAWREHQLQFVSRPLAEIVGEFNRYNRHKLVIADGRLAAKRFGGTFPADDYDGFVHILEKEFGVVSERSETETRLRLP